MILTLTIKRRGVSTAILQGILLLAFSNSARADDTHYQDYPLGGRAVGLGGAFGAISNDASGIFYNPAGLVDATRDSVSISSNLYGVEVAIEENLFSSVGTSFSDIEAVVADLNIIPSSAGYVGSLDARDKRGRHIHSYGWGVFVPSYRSLNIQTSDPKLGLSYRRDLLDLEFHTALAYAYRFDEDWSFGLSTVFNYRQLKDFEENTSVVTTGNFDQFETSQTSLKAFVGTTLVAFGVKVELMPNYFFGLSVNLPGIEVYDYADLRIMKTKTVRGKSDESTFELTEPENVKASFKHGGNLRLAFARIFPHKLTLSADLTLHAPVAYEVIEVQGKEKDLQNEITIETGIKRNFVGNIAAGLEWLFHDKMSLSLGGFTNFSSADQIPESKDDILERDFLPFVNEFGATAVLGYFTQHTLTRLGGVLTYGAGSDVIPQEGQFRKIDLQSIYIYVFFSSTFRY